MSDKNKANFLPETTADETPSSPPETILSVLPAELMSRITPAKTRMILLWLTGQYSQRKIANIIGCSEATIKAWLVDPAVQLIIKEIQQREFALIESNLKAMSYKAIDTMNELLDSDMDNVRFSAAKDILDRGGHKPHQNIKVDKTVTNIEQQLSQLADFTINEDEIIDIDIDDIVDEIKSV